MKGQLRVDLLEDAVEGSIAIVVRGRNNVDEETAGSESAGLHESSGNEHGPFGLLDLHASMDAVPVKSEGLLGIDEVGRWDEEAMRGSKGVGPSYHRQMLWCSSERSLGKCFMNDFW